MFSYLNYIFGYADLNEYEADEKSKRLKYLCCETIKNSKIKLKKVNNNSIDGLLNYELNRLNVNCDKYDFPIVQKFKKKRTKKC
jgi:hypothetical protein